MGTPLLLGLNIFTKVALIDGLKTFERQTVWTRDIWATDPNHI